MPVMTARRAMAVAMMMTGRRTMVAVFCHQILRARDDDRSRHSSEFGRLGAFCHTENGSCSQYQG